MPDVDKPGEATSRRRSVLVEQIAELERVLEGIELDPERRSMLRAAGYRTCVGIAWQSVKKQPEPAALPLPQAALAQPALTQPPMQPPAQPLPPPLPGAPFTPHSLPMPSPPPLGGGEGQPRSAGGWAQQLASRLQSKQLRNEEYSALCKLMGLSKGCGIYPSAEDCLQLTEAEAYDISLAQPRQQKKQGGWRR